MKILIASDSYKGSATTLEVANAIENGIREVYKDADIVKLPVADGGEGTVDALVIGTKGRYQEAIVIGPLGDEILAKYGILDENTAVIEMAAASGLTLVDKEKLNPAITTTYGTGQLIKSAMENGIRTIYLGLGGSATNDGGVGMAQALGISFKDELGDEIGYGGGELSKINEINFDNVHPLLNRTEIIGISDVKNPFCGPNGASYIFSPQKGASEEIVKILDNNLRYLGEKIKEYNGKDIINEPGTGAAGGLGGGLIAFCNGTIHSGIEKVLSMINMDRHLENTDLVITGEGKIDGQSIFGKVPIGIAHRAKKYDIPVIAIVGSIGNESSKVFDYGIDMIVDIIDKPMTLEEAMENTSQLIKNATVRLFKYFKSCKSKR